jgi:DNA-binding XRE family transcriptional regulator
MRSDVLPRGYVEHVDLTEASRFPLFLRRDSLRFEGERRWVSRYRWRRAMAAGSSAEQAAGAVGVARSTLYRWENAAGAEDPATAPHAATQLDARTARR